MRTPNFNSAVASNDSRTIEVITSGFPCRRGQQLAVDVTIRSVVTRDDDARPAADWSDGAMAAAARSDKERAYPEFARGDRCSLVVLAVEAGDRFSTEMCEFLRDLAYAKALAAPAYLRRAAALAHERRWSKILGIAVARAIAQSVLFSKEELACAPTTGHNEPWLQDVLSAARLEPVGSP